MRVLENIGKFRNDSKFSTWLYRIVYNQSLGFVKNSNRINSINYAQLFDDSEKSNNLEDRFQELYKAINFLDDTDRNIIMLFYLAEKSLREIAQITGFSIANIKVILHRARKKFFKKLDDEEK